MSVDTNTKGKNLSPYRQRQVEDMKVLVAPDLFEFAAEVRLLAKPGLLGSRLKVEAAAMGCTLDLGPAEQD
ncbi:MAG: hypothetical protein GY713_14060 [Actinomycetia bacterium]|nr:hypothetical protein [Actinomycetes bacterium]